MKLKRKERLSESFDRYDLEIDGNHNFVVSGIVVHNSNCKVGLVGEVSVAGSMEVRRKRPTDKDGNEASFESDEMKTSTYWFPWSLPSVRALLGSVTYRKSLLLYGEVYGGSVQSLDYGVPKGRGLGFRAFGLRVDGKFMDWDGFTNVCKTYGVETVPVLWRGAYSFAKIKELAEGKSVMADHIKEGVVVYPVNERTHVKTGRVVLKYISTDYSLSKHQERDTTDV